MFTTRSPSPQAPAIDTASTGVLLIGHGAAGRPESALALARHASVLDAAGSYAGVRHAVLEGGPDPAEARSALRGTDRILVLPLFMSDGYQVNRVLPTRLGPAGGAPLTICPPLGRHSGLPRLVADLAQEVRRARGWRDGGWDILLAAHGSIRDPASRHATEALAGQLMDLPGLRWLRTGYLEEPPYLTAIAAQLDRPTVVVGLFAADGGHAAEDVPTALLGAMPPVVYSGAIGTDRRIPGLLSEMIEGELAALTA